MSDQPIRATTIWLLGAGLILWTAIGLLGLTDSYPMPTIMGLIASAIGFTVGRVERAERRRIEAAIEAAISRRIRYYQGADL